MEQLLHPKVTVGWQTTDLNGEMLIAHVSLIVTSKRRHLGHLLQNECKLKTQCENVKRTQLMGKVNNNWSRETSIPQSGWEWGQANNTMIVKQENDC